MGKVCITVEEYKELLRCEYELEALECGGVDNWGDYCDCFSDYYEEEMREYIESKVNENKIATVEEVYINDCYICGEKFESLEDCDAECDTCISKRKGG